MKKYRIHVEYRSPVDIVIEAASYSAVLDLGRRIAEAHDRPRATVHAVETSPPRHFEAFVSHPILSKEERDIMEHATAWNHKQRLYRNHFVTDHDSDDGKIIAGLIERGLMAMTRQGGQLSGGMPVFAVTKAGQDELAKESP